MQRKAAARFIQRAQKKAALFDSQKGPNRERNGPKCTSLVVGVPAFANRLNARRTELTFEGMTGGIDELRSVALVWDRDARDPSGARGSDVVRRGVRRSVLPAFAAYVHRT